MVPFVERDEVRTDGRARSDRADDGRGEQGNPAAGPSDDLRRVDLQIVQRMERAVTAVPEHQAEGGGQQQSHEGSGQRTGHCLELPATPPNTPNGTGSPKIAIRTGMVNTASVPPPPNGPRVHDRERQCHNALVTGIPLW